MKLRIGTRGSALALKQCELVQRALLAHGKESIVEVILTTGDKGQNSPRKVSDKKEWIYEIECALLAGEIDLAIHSAKDIPVDIEPGTALRHVLRREDPSDLFISRSEACGGTPELFEALPRGSRIGTTSLRRRAELLRFRPDLDVVELRGNVGTRLEKLRTNVELRGTVLAAAGIRRLGDTGITGEPLPPEICLPAVNQGILAAQYRSEAREIQAILERLVHPESEAAAKTERIFVEMIGADCNSAVGVLASVSDGNVLLLARVLGKDGASAIEESESGLDHRRVAETLGRRMLELGARDLLEGRRG